jgi:hypothetical protein
MASFNDLIGLQYQWGARPRDRSGFTDCFALSMEARKRMGLRDYSPVFQWVYDQFAPEKVGGRQIIRWLWQYSEKTKICRNGAMFYISSGNSGIALATVVHDYSALFIGPSKRVIVAPLATVTRGKFFWAD